MYSLRARNTFLNTEAIGERDFSKRSFYPTIYPKGCSLEYLDLCRRETTVCRIRIAFWNKCKKSRGSILSPTSFGVYEEM
jgi:hypothetical protein